jgi:hypothetical protein
MRSDQCSGPGDVAFQHQGGGTPDIDLGYSRRKNRTLAADKHDGSDIDR